MARQGKRAPHSFAASPPPAISGSPGLPLFANLPMKLPVLFLALALLLSLGLPPCAGSYNGFVKKHAANATSGNATSGGAAANATALLNSTEIQQTCNSVCAGSAGSAAKGNATLGALLGLALNGSSLNKTHASGKSSPVCMADCRVSSMSITIQ